MHEGSLRQARVLRGHDAQGDLLSPTRAENELDAVHAVVVAGQVPHPWQGEESALHLTWTNTPVYRPWKNGDEL